MRCKRCLLYSGMNFHILSRQLAPEVTRDFHIGADGVCSICTAYEAHLDWQAIDNELAMFIVDHAKADAAPAIVAFSGGKDSMAALVQCVRTLKIPTVALLYDNGFIPDDVIEQATRVCEALDVPFEIARQAPTDARAFADIVDNATAKTASPCNACSAQIFKFLEAKADALGSTWLVVGTNYHAGWQQPITALNTRKTPRGRLIRRIHLPFAMRMTHDDTLSILDDLGAVIHKQRGASSNCRVPEIVQGRIAKSLGHPTELEDLSLEVMAGHLTRQAALAELARIESAS
jgi:PP-loop superfamily ATP-utilizing enzyme